MAGVPPCAWQGGGCWALYISAKQTPGPRDLSGRPRGPFVVRATESQRFPARGGLGVGEAVEVE